MEGRDRWRGKSDGGGRVMKDRRESEDREREKGAQVEKIKMIL